MPALTLETPQAQSWYSTTVPNRITSWSYDLNGNVLQVGSMARSFTYDAENRQVTACINCAPGPPTATYVYDGLGQRVSKTVNGQTTTYVYDAFGNLAAEYGGNSSGCGTCYVTTDHLGSTRLLTNAGGVFARYDYEPFGQEIFSGVDGRTTTMGYSALLPDNTNPKFTGQYQDVETADPSTGSSLDWFQVRHLVERGAVSEPRSGERGSRSIESAELERLCVCYNNPLSYTDPSGMIICVSCVVDESGNPVVIGVAAAIDLGALLGGLFGFGGGPSAIPSALATPSSPIMGSADDDIPGSSDSGTLFGSGNTDPFIFSVLQAPAGSPEDLLNYNNALAYLMHDPGMRKIINSVRSSWFTYKVSIIRSGNDGFNNHTIYWDPTSSYRTAAGGCQSAALGLGHELAHADSFALPGPIRASIPAGLA